MALKHAVPNDATPVHKRCPDCRVSTRLAGAHGMHGSA